MPPIRAAQSKIERWARLDSNQRPRNYEFPALTAAPRALAFIRTHGLRASDTAIMSCLVIGLVTAIYNSYYGFFMESGLTRVASFHKQLM